MVTTAVVFTQRPRPDRRTFIESDRAIARRLARPVRQFLDVETAGGLVLLAATVAALVLATG